VGSSLVRHDAVGHGLFPMKCSSELYDISGRLAVGNGCLVYKGVERASGRLVALKLLLPTNEASHPLDGVALLRDAPELTKFSGENIAQLLGVFADEDGTVIVYEMAAGERGLDVPANSPIPATRATEVAVQLFKALCSGEEQCYPHGDLKPEDIILAQQPDGSLRLTVLDWGLANYRNGLPTASLPYTAPERLDGTPPSHKSDLFSAGAVLSYLFTGHLPLEQSTALKTLRPDLPGPLVRFIGRLGPNSAASHQATASSVGTAS
jgi:eukaryotic-like serine/threonine-protein kinase